MRNNHRKNIMIHAIALFLILACALPGSISPAVPTANPNALVTIIAETAAAAAAQTQAASVVVEPSPTPTAIQVATAAAGPVFSLAESALVKQEDGSTLLIDKKGGYQVVVPSGWLAVRINEQEYYSAFANEAASDPLIHDRLTSIQTNDPDIFRLDAIDLRPGHTASNVITVLSVVLEDEPYTLEEWDQVEKDFPLPFENFVEVGSAYIESSNGIRVLIRERTWDSVQDGQTIYYRGAFFKLPVGTVILDFGTNLSMKDTLLPDFEQVINSLIFIDP